MHQKPAKFKKNPFRYCRNLREVNFCQTAVTGCQLGTSGTSEHPDTDVPFVFISGMSAAAAGWFMGREAAVMIPRGIIFATAHLYCILWRDFGIEPWPPSSPGEGFQVGRSEWSVAREMIDGKTVSCWLFTFFPAAGGRWLLSFRSPDRYHIHRNGTEEAGSRQRKRPPKS